MTAYCRYIGTRICCTFPNGNFTFLDSPDSLPAAALSRIEETGKYEGPIPESVYAAYLLLESEGQ